MSMPTRQLQPEILETKCARARPLLGTIVEITACGPNAEIAVGRAFRAVEQVHGLMSYHDPKSDVSRINRDAALHSVTVSPHTWNVLKRARIIATATDGLFDITVAPALSALGFLPRHPHFPRASGHGNWQHIELLPDRNVRFARQVRIDLGGIAKGYAVDRAIQVLQFHGMSKARVNAGGDLRMFGSHRQSIRLRRPGAPTELWPLIETRARAAATSAGYFSARRVRGSWVTPLIHPYTRSCGLPGRSVTVFAAECVTADALTKAVYADRLRATRALAEFSACALVVEEIAGLCRMEVFDATRGRWQEWSVPIRGAVRRAG